MAGLEWLRESVRNGVPLAESDVRTTVTTVDNNDGSAMADHAPEVNEHLTDADTDGGLTPRQVGGQVSPSVRTTPPANNGDDDALFGRVNRQVSSAGTAASRELAGHWGHGTIMVTDSIEPIVGDERPGMGDQYFAADPNRKIQEPMGDYMTPARQADSSVKEGAIATAANNSRAAADNPYVAFAQERTGIK